MVPPKPTQLPKNQIHTSHHSALRKTVQVEGGQQVLPSQACVVKETDSDESKALKEKTIDAAVEEVKYNLMREDILSKGARIDGRTTTDIRPIAVESGILPRVHGSALFTRGETQVRMLPESVRS